MPRVDVPEHGTFVDFPDGTPPEEMQAVLAKQFPQRDSLLTRAKKGITNFAVSTARAAAPLAFAAAPLLPEKTKQDLSNFYDEAGGFLAQNQPTKPEGISDRVVDAASGLAPAIASGPVGVVALLNNAITGKAAESRDAGDSWGTTIGKTAASGAAMAGNVALPLGRTLKTMGASGAGAVAINNADRLAQNALSGEKDQQAFDVTTNVLEPLIMQLGFGGMAHFNRARASSKLIDGVAGRMERGEYVPAKDINSAVSASKVFLRRSKRQAAQDRIATADSSIDARYGTEPVMPGDTALIADSEFSPDFGRPAPPVLDAEVSYPNAQTSVMPQGAHPDTASIEVARLKQEHPYWSDAEYLKEVERTVLTRNPEVLPARTDERYVSEPAPAERQSEDSPAWRRGEPIGDQEMGQRFGTSDRIVDPMDVTAPGGMLLNPEVLPARTDADRYAAPPAPPERPAEQAPSRTVPQEGMEGDVATAKTGVAERNPYRSIRPEVFKGRYGYELNFFDPITDQLIGKTVLSNQMKQEPDYLFMRSINISDKAHLGKGLGSEMYRAAVEFAGENGYKGISSDPQQRNDASEKFWKNPTTRPSGFQVIDAERTTQFNHDSLPTAAVTAKDSLVLQDAAPQLKIAVVGTPAEIKALGKQPAGKTTWVNGDKAYVIDVAAARDKYGSVLEAKRALKAGGDAESEALGYPARPVDAPLQTAAVTKAGEILTEPESIKQAATAGDVAYAAEGAPADLAAKIEPVADALASPVYTIKIKVGDAIEERFAVPAPERMGFKRGYGDELYKTRVEAEAAYKQQVENEARLVESETKRADAERVAEQKRAEREDIGSFGADLPPVQLGKVKAALLARQRFNGVEMSRKDAIEKMINDGYKIGDWKGERTLVDPEGAFFTQKQITKTGLDYAQHLLDTKPDPTMLHAGIHLPTLLADAKKVWKHYTEKLDPTAPAGSLKAEFDKNRKANEKFGREPLLNKMRRAAIDSSANVQAALMRLGPAGEHVRRQFDAISGASAKAQLAVEKQRGALSGMSLREQQAMGDMVAIDRDLAISKPGYTKIFGKTDAELRTARATFQQDYKLTDAEMARVENATRQYFDAWKANTQRMLDAGLIDATQKQALDAQDYSPKQFLEKIDPDSQAFSAIGGGRVTVPDSGIKRLKEGSDSYFRNNPMRLLSEATARIETRIARNEANQELAKLPAGNGIAEVVKPGTPAPAGYEALTYMENGKQKTIHMKSEYAKEWRQNDPLINSELVNWLQWLSGAKLVRAGATGYNPAFLVTNVPRDLVTIWMQAGDKGYSKHAPVAMVEVATDLVKVSGDAWKRKGRYVDYVQQGGGRELLTHEGALSARRENLAPAVAKVQKVLSYVNEFSEVVTRLAYRERMIKNGMDPANASKAAGEYVDFSRGGSVAKAVDRMGIPYLNAAIQGTRSIARAAGRDPGAFAYKTAQLMTGAAGIYALNQITNPEGWANVSDREKADNFIIMLPKAFEYTDKDGTTVSPYLKISKEQSTRPFTTVAELFTHWANGGKPTKQQLEMALGSAVPISIDKMPPAAAAFWTYALNADTYRKEPVWKGKQEIEPYAEYTNNTNPIYAAIGKTTASPDEQGVMRGGISPERLKAGVEKIITPSNAYLQGVGNVLTDLYEKMNPSDKVEFAKGNYEQLRAVPGISRLLGGAKDTEQFREGIREARTGTATEQFEVNKTLDAMVLRYVKTGKSDAALYDRISDFLDKQSGESRSRLENRITGLMETADLPDRGWWMAVRALQPEDRADQFKERLKTVSPEEQQRMIEIADGLTGFVSDRFIERYEGAQ